MNDETILSLVELLFNRLRLAGLPLGIDEYLTLLKALRLGFSRRKPPTLETLCRMTWVKSREDEAIFAYHFTAVMETVATTPITPSVTQPGGQPGSDQAPKDAVSQPAPSPEEVQRSFDAARAGDLARQEEDAITNQQVIWQLPHVDQEMPYRAYLLQTDYLPVTRRQMVQSWRRLRKMVRVGLPTELDMGGTVQRLGRDGLLLAPILWPRRVNQATVLLLLDQKGSMVPFHSLGRRLAQTAVAAGRPGYIQTFYFQNCPPIKKSHLALPSSQLYREHQVYREAQCRGAKDMSQILGEEYSGRAPAVFIFSDAGAARHSWSEDRIQGTALFVYQLRQLGVDHIAWLNPMPPNRWRETSAADISNFVPMFSMSYHGLMGAIDVLRGRSTHKVRL